jgi:hypothetical protein
MENKPHLQSNGVAFAQQKLSLESVSDGIPGQSLRLSNSSRVRPIGVVYFFFVFYQGGAE